MTGTPTGADWLASPGARPWAACTRSGLRIVRVAQVQADAVAAEHLVGLGDQIGQDLVQVAAGVDDRQQIAQTFGAQAPIGIQRDCGHASRNITGRPHGRVPAAT